MRPDPSVLAAFGLEGVPRPLVGGYETSVLVDGVVLKQVMDVGAACVGQEVQTALVSGEVRVAQPLTTLDGAWSNDGWIATRFIEGLRSARNDHDLLVKTSEQLAAALAECSALVECSLLDLGALGRRTDRWAEADRHVWGEVEVALSDRSRIVADALEAQTEAVDSAEHAALVHADLAGNTFVDPDGRPVVLDFSLTVRPARYQTGIVVADTLLWDSGDPMLVSCADDDSVARGLLFRLVAAELAPGTENGDRGRCERVARSLGWA